jgi:thioredoxin reductase
MRAGSVRDVAGEPGGFTVDVDGARVCARAIVLASGLRYVPPPLPGLGPLWGRSVFHCPFCDGWEVHDRALAVHADGAAGVRRGLLLRAWSDDVLVAGRLSVAERAELRSAGVRTRSDAIHRLEAHDADPGRLRRIRFADGSVEACDALFVAPRLERHDTLATRLGCAPRTGEPALVAVDAGGRTTVPGVYAAGDLAEPERSVANAVGSGARVGKAMVLDLLRPAQRPADPRPRRRQTVR